MCLSGKKSKEDRMMGGMLGLCIGDAVGLPVEGVPRQVLKQKPVTGFMENELPTVPSGWWSDDSSLAFCLAESLCGGFRLHDIADKFTRWFYQGYWTPSGKAFGIGGTTAGAVRNLKKGAEPVKAGGKNEYSNGNGSLMRILPAAFYLEDASDEQFFNTIHQISSITHAHPRSLMACGIYIYAYL